MHVSVIDLIRIVDQRRTVFLIHSAYHCWIQCSSLQSKMQSVCFYFYSAESCKVKLTLHFASLLCMTQQLLTQPSSAIRDQADSDAHQAESGPRGHRSESEVALVSRGPIRLANGKPCLYRPRSAAVVIPVLARIVGLLHN